MENKQTVVGMCLYCEKEFPKVRDAVELYVKQHKTGGPVKFSHGYCIRHYGELLRQYGKSDDEIKLSIEKAKNNGGVLLDLKEHPDLVDAYSKGIFTKEQLQHVNQTQQQDNNKITERFKKLAGINF